MELKKHPPWKEAVNQILSIFREQGYGAVISNEERDRMLSICKPEGLRPKEEYDKYQLSTLQIYHVSDKLLKNHDICLYHKRGTDGFVIVHPNEQVTIVAEQEEAEIKKHTRKYLSLLIHIPVSLLTEENKKKRNDGIAKWSGIARLANKKRIQGRLTNGNKKQTDADKAE